MTIRHLDHVNIRTSNLESMIKWYEDILGLKSGWRPDFPFRGAWLYVGEYPFVHLVETDQTDAVGAEAFLKLEHFAFAADNETDFKTLLDDQNIDYRCGEPPGANIRQYNIHDPDGNHIHVDFKLEN